MEGLPQPVERPHLRLVHQHVPESHYAEDDVDEREDERPVVIGACNLRSERQIPVQRHESIHAERKDYRNDCKARLEDALLEQANDYKIEHGDGNQVRREHCAGDYRRAVLDDAGSRQRVVAVGNEKRHPVEAKHQQRKRSYQKPPNGLLSLYHFYE